MNTWIIDIQDSNSPITDMLIYFHDTTMMILIFIIMLIFYIMMSILNNSLIDRFLFHGHLIEMIWTLMPMFVLVMIAFPSLKILYLMDDIHSSKLTVKSIGHQWYWSYEYTDFNNIEFDSFMIPTSQLNMNEFRLLEVDNRCILPFDLNIRMLTSSMDVIHAWTVPSLGIKMDSVPGRINQSNLLMFRPGVYFGQCSEICGLNHSFMPIVVESTNFNNFKKWLLLSK